MGKGLSLREDNGMVRYKIDVWVGQGTKSRERVRERNANKPH